VFFFTWVRFCDTPLPPPFSGNRRRREAYGDLNDNHLLRCRTVRRSDPNKIPVARVEVARTVTFDYVIHTCVCTYTHWCHTGCIIVKLFFTFASIGFNGRHCVVRNESNLLYIRAGEKMRLPWLCGMQNWCADKPTTTSILHPPPYVSSGVRVPSNHLSIHIDLTLYPHPFR